MEHKVKVACVCVVKVMLRSIFIYQEWLNNLVVSFIFSFVILWRNSCNLMRFVCMSTDEMKDLLCIAPILIYSVMVG